MSPFMNIGKLFIEHAAYCACVWAVLNILAQYTAHLSRRSDGVDFTGSGLLILFGIILLFFSRVLGYFITI